MKRFSVFLVFFLLTLGLKGQLNKYGTPLMKNFSTQITPGTEQNWWITKDKFGAVYFANDDRGVIRYDGTTWTNIPVRNNARVRCVESDKYGIIYVAGAYEFGFIEPDSKGKLVYASLSAKYDKPKVDSISNTTTKVTGKDSLNSEVNIGEIFSIAILDTTVYYLSDESLFIYNIRSRELNNINLRNLGFRQFVRIYNIYNRIFLAENLKGLFELKNGKVELLPGGEKFAGMMALTVLPVSDGKVLVGTYKNGIYLYDYNTGTIDNNWVDKKDAGKLSMIYCGVNLPSGDYAFGTIGGEGIYILDKDGHLTDNWNSRNTEMKDDMVSALFAGKDNNELWITTFGNISKVYTSIPITQFSEVTGINTGVNGINELNGIIYVSTDNGVLRSTTDNTGYRRFEELKGIDDQVFPLTKAEMNGTKMIFAGSALGLYRITGNGDVLLVDNPSSKFEKNSFPALVARCITQSKLNPSRLYLGTTSDGVIIIDLLGVKAKHINSIKRIQGNVAFQYELSNGDLIVMTDYPNALYRLKYNDSIPHQYSVSDGLPQANLTYFGKINNELVVSSSRGLFKFDEKNDNWATYNEATGGFSAGKDINSFYQDPQQNFWLELNDDRYDLMFFTKKDSQIVSFRDQFRLLPNVKMLDIKSINNRIWLTKSKNVYVVNQEAIKPIESRPLTMFTRIIVGRDSLLMNGTFSKTMENGQRIPVIIDPTDNGPEIKYKLNSISFYWVTPYYIEEDQTKYSYKLEGFTNEWSNWESIHYKDFTNLPFGKYTFRVKARTMTNVESQEAVYEFYILKPWYLKTGMIILYAIVFVLIIFAIIKAYTRKLKNENIRLEGIVAERTAVVVKQKEELESSIHYASRIQMALLPSEAILAENLKNYFILFRPRDIVSGDFYWMTKKDNRLYVVAADCTGHGVPGAFMSLLGMSFLDEIIDKETSPRADQILSELRLHVTDSLKQVGGDDEAKDGMDMALLVIDFNVNKIEFSGAYNPCFRVRKMSEEEAKNYHDEDKEAPDGSMANGRYLLETIYASKMPIGISSRMDENFVFYDWALEKGVSYYLFSDGYIDQFGGPNGRKFMKKNFKKFILEIQEYPMSKQKELLEQNLKEWMGHSPQIDDILVMGIRTE